MSGIPYRTIVADPPWAIPWTGGGKLRKNGRGEVHVSAASAAKTLPYPTMSIDAIAGLPVAGLAAADAALFLWIPDRFLLDGIAPRVVTAWGFARERLFIWRKSGYGLGTFPRPQHEVCVVAVRGRSPFVARDIGSVQDFKVVYEVVDGVARRKHSAKPDGFSDLVERASPGPYLELFARRQRLGWDTWGNEALNHVELGAA